MTSTTKKTPHQTKKGKTEEVLPPFFRPSHLTIHPKPPFLS